LKISEPSLLFRMSEEKPAEPAAEAAPEGEGGEQLEVRILI